MRIGDVLELVEHAMGVALKEVNVWYTMKFDRRLLLHESTLWSPKGER